MATTTTKPKADRAAINRRNAQKSTGPRTAAGKDRSRFNALKHGMTAKTPVLPGEDAEALQRRRDAWTADLAPGNAVEQYFVDRAVQASWQLDRADRADVARLTALIHSATDDQALRQAEDAEALGRRLFWDRRGPIALYPHFPISAELSPNPKPRVSFSGLADDPDDPARLVLRLEATHAGCQWLLERWQELRVVLNDDIPWQSPDKLKAIRLMGKQPLDAADNADVAAVLLAAWVLDPKNQEFDAFEDVWKELFPPEVDLFRERLLGRDIEAYLPEDKPAAVAALVKIIDMYVARLEGLAAAHRERAMADAVERSARLSFDPSADGERLRRYQASCDRSLSRSIGTLLTVRRADGRGPDSGPGPLEPELQPPSPGPEVPPPGIEIEPAIVETDRAPALVAEPPPAETAAPASSVIRNQATLFSALAILPVLYAMFRGRRFDETKPMRPDNSHAKAMRGVAASWRSLCDLARAGLRIGLRPRSSNEVGRTGSAMAILPRRWYVVQRVFNITGRLARLNQEKGRAMRCNGWVKSGGLAWFIGLAMTSAAGSGETREGRAGAPLVVHERVRVPGATAGQFVVEERTERWAPAQTAIVICDMWNQHWCRGATRRVGELAPAMNRAVAAARDRGVLIVHAPSSCMGAYKNHPARKRAQAAPTAANLPKDIVGWCDRVPAEEKGVYPIDQSDGGCDDGPPCPQGSPWTSQIAAIEIHDDDAISDSGVEIWNLLEARGIKNVLLMGVHTNMCVLGRPFGLRQLARHGKNAVLVRDLTDTMYNSRSRPYVSHFEGTNRIVEHIEKYVAPTIESTDLTGGPAFRFQADDRPRAVFVIGEDEYRTETTLPAFALKELEPLGIRCTMAIADPKSPHDFPGVAALDDADLLVLLGQSKMPRRSIVIANAAQATRSRSRLTARGSPTASLPIAPARPGRWCTGRSQGSHAF